MRTFSLDSLSKDMVKQDAMMINTLIVCIIEWNFWVLSMIAPIVIPPNVPANCKARMMKLISLAVYPKGSKMFEHNVANEMYAPYGSPNAMISSKKFLFDRISWTASLKSRRL